MSDRESDETFESLRRKVKKTYYVCLVVQLAKSQVSEGEREAIKRYTKVFGVQSWARTFIILSYAKSVKPNLNFATLWRERANELRYEIAKHVGWDIASAVHIIASQDFKTIMSEQPAWLVEQYSVIEQMTELGGADTFFLVLPEDTLLPDAFRSPTTSRINNSSWPQSSSDINSIGLPNYVISLSCLCVTSGPLAALGIIIAGPLGCSIALIINLILWVVLCRFFG